MNARLVIVSLMLCCASCMGLSDLRPTELQREGVTPEQEARGQAMLKQAAKVHGSEGWDRFTTYELIMHDKWGDHPLISRRNPWPDDSTWMKYQYIPGAKDARVEFLDGPEQGVIWGYSEGKTYRIDKTGEVVVGEEPRMAHRLPTIQWLYEFPARIGEAPIIAYAGSGEVAGQIYGRVFATWGSFEPNATLDQYLVWIHLKTGRIEMIEYTNRTKGKSIIGHRRFEDWRQVEGILIPFYQTSNTALEGGLVVHEFFLKSVRFDPVSKAELQRLPGP